MQMPAYIDFDINALTDEITSEMRHRCNVIANTIAASEKLERYTATVTSFVRCINADFFAFIEQLDRKLRDQDFGSAKLTIDDDQPELVGSLLPYPEWTIRGFALLCGRLAITLNYKVAGEMVRSQDISARVLFFPNEGYLEWSEDSLEVFRSHRDKAVGKPEFGQEFFEDLVSRIGIKKRGFDIRHGENGDMMRFDPQILVLRKICLDPAWPGWPLG
ncbi:hypothetical protein [Sphingomonas carotinifaciens]|uniref:Uncharacterized protein n=1 Tax=Sphingomonas carotinifaciens TaxID=1166323 RepID=A0A1G7PNM5_9SPHN|nr:hypothetical protein [Sphingomonas carotinifaciens]MBB4087621.1 hypothetical protein [Sphingomonas carotinifaciens]MWC45706.1 hypothetical protein [Sphingomonas carotinifaciens]SDF87847.1 hypothetical protein SAMN05216557_10711 [Sphingomonas carotinifaciens]